MTEPDSEHGLSFRPSGDTGLTVVVGDQVDHPTRARVLALSKAITEARLPGVIETVPAYLSVLVHYDPLKTGQADLIVALRALDWVAGVEQIGAGRRWHFPLCADGADFAADLADVADWVGLTPEEVLGDITSTVQTVYMLGFAPGQPYIGDLPDRLAVPRRKTPVPRVPAGSVLIATGKTVIYPTANPTGWHIVGRTPIPIFNPTVAEPVLLAPGDEITFHRIDLEQFNETKQRIEAGDVDLKAEFSR